MPTTCGLTQLFSDLVSMDVASPSHIKASSIDLVLTNAPSAYARPLVKLTVASGIISASSVSTPFRLDDCNSSGIPSVVSGESEPSWTSRGVTDEASKTLSPAEFPHPAPLRTLQNRRPLCMLQMQQPMARDGRWQTPFIRRAPVLFRSARSKEKRRKSSSQRHISHLPGADNHRT
jgi:hypothetical protein